MIILGIETSCDETALALIEARWDAEAKGFECRVIESLVHSQADLHSAYGGVFPSLAKREHGKNLLPLLHKLLIRSADVMAAPGSAAHSAQAGRTAHPARTTLSDRDIADMLASFKDDIERQNPDLYESFAGGGADFLKNVPAIDRIAVTEGPGLEPTLWVGINCARMLGALWQVPIIPVDHMEGHILGSLLPSDATNGVWQSLHEAPLPAVALLVSGGHTELVKVSRLGSYEILGKTRDDAVGEAFDKAARLLGLPYPGGPHLAELSHKAWEEKIPSPVKLPRPMLASGDLDFSFAGLKTAVLYAVRDASGASGMNSSPASTSDMSNPGNLTNDFKKGLAHEFEMAVADTLDSKLRSAIEQTGARSVIVGGGVSANHVLRQRFTTTAADYGIPLFLPSRHISGDNALMIAVAGAVPSCRYHDARTDPGAWYETVGRSERILRDRINDGRGRR